MEHVRWHAHPTLARPTLLAAFTGWNDAGDAASAAVRQMIEAWDARPLASVDPEEFTDFATTRPYVRLATDLSREIVWPTVSSWHASTPGGDVILVLGPEPSLRWRLFCEQITGIGTEMKVGMVVTMGALLADVPHRRPINLVGTSTDQDLIDRFDLQRSRYEGPTGIVGVLHDACARAGFPTVSLWAAVPAYASQIPSPKAAAALVRRSSDVLGAPAPLRSLLAEIEEYEERVDQVVNDDEDLASYVRRLESIADAGLDPEDYDDDLDASAESDDDDDDDTDDTVGGELGDAPERPIDAAEGDRLIEEVERFLRDQGQS
jgi:hypothetical protein